MNLLCRKGGKGTSADGRVGLNHLRRGKGPARAALALVLDGRNGALLPPVHRLRQIPGGKVLDMDLDI